MDGAALLGRGSLWAATAAPGPECPSLDDEVAVDVGIVGGGFTGLSTALHLAERGVRVAVVEAKEIGEGASGLNGGQVIPGLKRGRDELAARFGGERAERMVALGDGAGERVYEIVRRYGIECGLERNGWFRGAHSPMAMAYLEKTAAEMAGRGVDAVLVDRADTVRMLGTDQYLGGLHDRRAGAVQPLAYVRGLARAAIGQGALVFARSPVERLARDGAGWRIAGVRGAVLAPRVLLATGAYTDRLWPGLAQTFVGVQSAQMATAPLSDNLRASVLPCRAVVSDTRKLSNYFRIDAGGRLVMGGRGPLGDTPSPSTLAAIARAAERRFPMLGRIEWKHAWCGRIDMTLDEMPRIHQPEPGLWTVLGYNGRGVALATTMGAVMADRMTGGGDPALDFPETPFATVPFHAFRGPGVAGAIAWYKFRDSLGFAA